MILNYTWLIDEYVCIPSLVVLLGGFRIECTSTGVTPTRTTLCNISIFSSCYSCIRILE